MPIRPFFSIITRWLFERRVEREIYFRMFPHLCGEADHGYSFDSDKEMDAQTERIDPTKLLEALNRDIDTMPDSWGRCFRHIVHRDLSKRLRLYSKLAERHARRDSEANVFAVKA